VEVLQFGLYRTVLVALFCGSSFLAVCILVLGCGRRWLVRRRRVRREQKLRQQSKHQRCGDVDASGCSLTVCDQRFAIPDKSSKIETVAAGGAPLSNLVAVPSIHNVCHCLPRGLRRKSPATAVIRRGRSIESLPVGRLPAELAVKVPRLMHSASLAVLQRLESTGSRPDLVQVSSSDNDSTPGAKRWKPITVAGETMFPVQPSAAIFLSFDVDNSVRYQHREPQET